MHAVEERNKADTDDYDDLRLSGVYLCTEDAN